MEQRAAYLLPAAVRDGPGVRVPAVPVSYTHLHFVKQVKPRYALLLNVMRDQLDRFGEIDTTAKPVSYTHLADTACPYRSAHLLLA